MEYKICSSCEMICPYCKHKEEYNGDPIGDDGARLEVICENCNKNYVIVVSISVDHLCYPLEGEVIEE